MLFIWYIIKVTIATKISIIEKTVGFAFFFALKQMHLFMYYAYNVCGSTSCVKGSSSLSWISEIRGIQMCFFFIYIIDRSTISILLHLLCSFFSRELFRQLIITLDFDPYLGNKYLNKKKMFRNSKKFIQVYRIWSSNSIQVYAYIYMYRRKQG